MTTPSIPHTNIALIGAGIMSATLGTLLKQLAPEKSITVFERLGAPALESSQESNNAGTGHAALCELNYTPQNPDGSISINRAVAINEKFSQSLQLWAHWAKQGYLRQPENFIQRLPHISFVTGERDIQFLRARHAALVQHPLFAAMQYSEDAATLRQWLPLMMNNRPSNQAIAATHIAHGTDVNFGELTRQLFDHLAQQQAEFHYNTEVTAINRTTDQKWTIASLKNGVLQQRLAARCLRADTIASLKNGVLQQHTADFVFIGAGGGSLHLLQKTGIPESQHIGGFPVSGLFLVCRNENIIAQHHAKVYGKAKVGAPPMSVPHLDTRYIDGKKALLFGPFAGFSPKFLKYGSICDLPASLKPHNLRTVLSAGIKNRSLTQYLIGQVLLSKAQRIQELREFIPDAREEDWELSQAGQRVQIIKDTASEHGSLQFGTEVIHAQDGSLAALLGASPGASTSVAIMLEVLQKCFAGSLKDWEGSLKTMIPSYGQTLADQPELLARVNSEIEQALFAKPFAQPNE